MKTKELIYEVTGNGMILCKQGRLTRCADCIYRRPDQHGGQKCDLLDIEDISDWGYCSMAIRRKS